MYVLPKGSTGFAPLFGALLLVSPPAWAEEAPAADPPPITIVKDGGVADTYRREGAAFAAYGPDEKQPAAPSEAVEDRALRALSKAGDIELVALKSEPGVPANLSCGSACVGGYPVSGRVPVRAVQELAFVRGTVADWLAGKAEPAGACLPVFGHAVKYSHDSYRYEVLLAYNCGQYRILRGGVPVAEGSATDPPGKGGIDALLRAG
ncbi:DUF411 domain-containing protein [Arenimonas daejeonensis]|uniref:DUF411 domain-containing protein n=1 Tax=Arenimonas daejeonensis TaxID=370777 RepID=UPI0011BD68CC|nr:DUF411 domain-containing protein [Arenimonas daejeonensis]